MVSIGAYSTGIDCRRLPLPEKNSESVFLIAGFQGVLKTSRHKVGRRPTGFMDDTDHEFGDAGPDDSGGVVVFAEG